MVRMRWVAVVNRLCVLGVGAFALGGCGNGVPDVIRIGVAQPLSGPSAARGADLLNGAELAVKELNSGNFRIDGKTVQFEIVARDDKADVATAKQVAQELVDAKVAAVIGHLSSDISEATVPIYKAGNVPQLFTSTATDLTRLGEGNAFRLVANDLLQAQALAGYTAESLRASTVAVVYENTAYGRPMSEDIVKTLASQQKRVAFQGGVDNKTTQFSAQVSAIKDAKVDAVIAVLRDNQLVPLLEQLAAAGLSEVPVLASNPAKTSKLASASLPTQRLYVTSGAIEAREFIGGTAFLEKFRGTYKSDPVWAAHYAYDAVYVLAGSMQKARTIRPKELKETLRAFDPHAPVTSSMRFDDKGEQRYAAISVYKRDKSNWDPLMRSDKW